MRDEKHIPNFEQPFRGVIWEIPKQCKDCFFRDRTTVDGKEYGWHKCVCSIFSHSKPNEVMENTELCEYYEKEKKKK